MNIIKEAKEKNTDPDVLAKEKIKQIEKHFGDNIFVRYESGYLNLFFNMVKTDELTDDLLTKEFGEEEKKEDFLRMYVRERLSYVNSRPGGEEQAEEVLRREILAYYYGYEWEKDVFSPEEPNPRRKEKGEKGKKYALGKLAETFYETDRLSTQNKIDKKAYKILGRIFK